VGGSCFHRLKQINRRFKGIEVVVTVARHVDI
jgi:hypothetical protein